MACYSTAMGAKKKQAKYKAIKVTNGGTITGVVKFKGTAPKLKALAVTKNPELCGKTTPDPSIVINGANEIKNVVVTIEGIKKGKKAVPVKGAVLDNSKCVYTPHMQAVTKGTTVTVVNSDEIMHNTHAWFGKKTVFNLALPLKDQKIKKRLRRSGMMRNTCDAGHGWMSAYIYVSEHPYYAVTDKSGKFTIKDIPPGTYKIKAWHESLGAKVKKKVKISAKGKASVNFSFASK